MLNKVLYKLKQLTRIWFYTLKLILLKLRFKELNNEVYLFINNNIKVIIYLYINDLIILTLNKVIFNNFIKLIS